MRFRRGQRRVSVSGPRRHGLRARRMDRCQTQGCEEKRADGRWPQTASCLTPDTEGHFMLIAEGHVPPSSNRGYSRPERGEHLGAIWGRLCGGRSIGPTEAVSARQDGAHRLRAAIRRPEAFTTRMSTWPAIAAESVVRHLERGLCVVPALGIRPKHAMSERAPFCQTD